jgi:hypothetical protein
MRLTAHVLVVLAICRIVQGSASAQSAIGEAEPFEGTWIMNAAKSTLSEPAAPKARTLIIDKRGSDFLYSIETTNADGSIARIRYTVPVRGGDGSFLEGPYDGVVHRRIDAYTREAEYRRAGKVLVTFAGRVSEDGRVLRIIAKNRDNQGHETESVTVYEKR